MRIALLLAASLIATAAGAQPARQTYINPIDIDYRYNFEQLNDGISYRTGADPAVVRFRHAFYLFETLADGYWRSTDLVHWAFITPSRWPFQSIVAPAVWADGDERILIQPSMTRPESILSSSAPETGQLDFWVRRMPDLPGAVGPGQEDSIKRPDQVPAGPWDPALFKDDDGKWYLYWNSSNVFPLYAMEIAFKDGRLIYHGPAKPMLKLDPEQHGWERFGQDHSGGLPNGTPIKPYMEGAWMTKVNGRYYLQYGAPGTEYNAYSNGTYVSDKPLGPYEYAPYNPVAYKPGGFVQGAGHGSTFEDNYGNWWNTGTPWIGYNWTFERRIGMWPASFAADGQMSVTTRFGDFPQYMPTGKVTNLESLFTGWMLLSYRKAASASSTMGEFAADRVTDENPRTFWVAGANRAGETLTVDLGGPRTLRAVQVNFADYKSGRFADAPDIYTEFELQSSIDGKNWSPLARTEAPRRDRPNAYFELPAPVQARYVRYVHGHVGAANLAISDIRVFGSAGGKAPAMPAGVTAKRDTDARNAHVAWKPVKGAVGYNVMWGIRPDRLTLTYQVWADRTAQDIRALNVGQDYWVAVEAFDENGVSKRSKPMAIR
jgi:xylan 1,4-beta-xylosidase